MTITKDFVLSNALELSKKVYEDPFFEEDFHRTAKELERILLEKQKITIFKSYNPLKVDNIYINDEDPMDYEIKINGQQNQEEARDGIYHETIHLLFALYRTHTRDKFLKKTNHPSIEKARQHIRRCCEQDKKFFNKYFMLPITNIIGRLFGLDTYPVDLDNIEKCDEKSQKKL